LADHIRSVTFFRGGGLVFDMDTGQRRHEVSDLVEMEQLFRRQRSSIEARKVIIREEQSLSRCCISSMATRGDRGYVGHGAMLDRAIKIC
jgi:hypothetical protein